MNRTTATGVNAVAALAPQLVALIGLGAEPFGKFSLIYLLYGLGLSIVLSVVCESCLRVSHRSAEPISGERYLNSVGWLSFAIALLAALVGGLLTSSVFMCLSSALAVGFAVYRSGARYREVQFSWWHVSIRADFLGLIALALTLITLRATTQLPPIEVLTAAWALAGATTTLAGIKARPRGPRELFLWIREYRSDIGPLIRESLLMDLSSIIGPYAIAPLLGTGHFGIYRAVSNPAAPVRLAINPLRPKIATLIVGSANKKKMILGLGLIAFLLGALSYGALFFIKVLNLPFGVLVDLAAYALPTALFVGIGFLSHISYLFVRTKAMSSQLLRARLIQSGAAFALPIVGATGGLSLAIWAYVMATFIGAIAWFRVAMKELT